MGAYLLVDNRDEVEVVTPRVSARLVVHCSDEDQFGSRREQHWGRVQQLARCMLMVSKPSACLLSQWCNALGLVFRVSTILNLLPWQCHAGAYCSVCMMLECAGTRKTVQTMSCRCQGLDMPEPGLAGQHLASRVGPSQRLKPNGIPYLPHQRACSRCLHRSRCRPMPQRCEPVPPYSCTTIHQPSDSAYGFKLLHIEPSIRRQYLSCSAAKLLLLYCQPFGSRKSPRTVQCTLVQNGQDPHCTDGAVSKTPERHVHVGMPGFGRSVHAKQEMGAQRSPC